METTMKKYPDILTRGTKRLIANTIERTGSFNRTVLLNAICDELCDKFPGDSLEYQLKRMNLNTTGDISRAIDVYMFKYYKRHKHILNDED